MNKKSFMKNSSGEELYLTMGKYTNNDRLYIGLETIDEPYCDITINLPEAETPTQESVFLSNDIPQEVYDKLIKDGMISNILWQEQYNMGTYDMVQIFPETFKEYLTEQEYEENILKDKEWDLDI